MEYIESNFGYLKGTKIEKYYNDLIKAEFLCEYYPIVTKIIVRKVMEMLLRDIAQDSGMDMNVSALTLLNGIKLKSNISFSEEIYNNIEIILANGYENISKRDRNRKIPKHPIEILKIAQKVLYYYLKEKENLMLDIKNLSFSAPSTIEYMKKELLKINNDIAQRENLINNLRKKILEVDSSPKRISEINNIIILIKEEKAYLEEIQDILNRKVEMQNKCVLNMETDYKTYEKKLNEMKIKFNENEELLLEKEGQLLKAEIQNQELKISTEELDDEDESIKRMKVSLDEELRILRHAYESLLNLTEEYNDIVETIEFLYDNELRKELEAKKNSIQIKINFEDAVFNENIIIYNKNTVEYKRKALIFKELVNENIKREIRHEKFYDGFLRLSGKELKIVYTIINNITSSFNLISKPKELLGRYNEDKFLELLNRNLENLKNINDNEIKLILYYKLISLSNAPYGKIYNRRKFVQTLDYMVDKAYSLLATKKDFKARTKKLDAINEYYMNRTISALKNKGSNTHITEELIEKIYDIITKLRQRPENKEKRLYYEKLDLDVMTESAIKAAIKSQPYTFLYMIADLASIDSYKDMSSIIFQIENLIEKRSLIKNFSNTYFMVLLYLSSDAIVVSQNQQEELVPLAVMLITSVSLVSDNDFINLEGYNDLVKLWKQKQQKYNDICMKKEEEESSLALLMREKLELEINQKELSEAYDSLLRRYGSYESEFKNLVMNSEKRVLLPSYFYYDDLCNKKKLAEKHINESKNKIGTLKSIFSIEVWKDQANKFINESNMLEAEKLLIKEAKQKPYFKKEYSVFLELEDQIQKVNESMEKNKEMLKSKDALVDNIGSKIIDLQKQLTTMKNAYIDIEGGY
ncbi:hypothetical protein [Clostridium beijerinckii]|uniref:Chromosome partition protein Smc n=2 Tax=Clostridium beijerinckii TaxID=1520 RepID=A0AB74VGH1_CLOBE|nr:hypothetical protein [Clostridium beijerinckii]MBC2456112.1 hypothetical protein [Clostridium beijerinckii]MBC2473659.1 hypothetical protein [Clostridium beijerinckii]NOV63000.1 hypothetical protein [Clostridium beijerinckii]NOV70038.1 hypothetical protein [Clostridium beijerinckii]NOW31055.1 hypothetical protein [Clostridium beijerinckii]